MRSLKRREVDVKAYPWCTWILQKARLSFETSTQISLLFIVLVLVNHLIWGKEKNGNQHRLSFTIEDKLQV